MPAPRSCPRCYQQRLRLACISHGLSAATRCTAPGLLLAPEIDDEDVGEDGLEDLDEGLVIGVREVGGAALFVVEGDDEAVGEILVESFGAVVGAPFQGGDFRDLLLEGDEGFLDFLDLGLGGVVLELEGDDVLKLALGCGFLGGVCGVGHGGEEDCQGEAAEEGAEFHGLGRGYMSRR